MKTSFPINTALCSFGMSGRYFHAPFIAAHAGFNLYGITERSAQTAGMIYPDAKTFKHTDDMLNDPAVDLVIINTPNITHFSIAKLALQKGKHVVVEKPFTSTAAEAAELISLAEQNGLVLSVYQNRRWDSDFMQVKEIVESGALGKIVEAELHFDRFKPQLSIKQHKEKPAEATGIVYDLGAHLIDQALVLFGFPDAVFADMMQLRPGSQIDDYMEIILFYDQLRVRVKGSYIVKEPLPAYSIHGTKGSFIKQRADVQETDLQNGRSVQDTDWGTEPSSFAGRLYVDDEIRTTAAPRGNYMEFYNGIYAAIRNQASPYVTAKEAAGVIRIIEAAYESHAKKKLVNLH